MWDVVITFQERGTKKELSQSASFQTRDAAVAALEKLEAEVAQKGADDFIIVDSGRHRISFLKQDFRRTYLHESPDSII